MSVAALAMTGVLYAGRLFVPVSSWATAWGLKPVLAQLVEMLLLGSVALLVFFAAVVAMRLPETELLKSRLLARFLRG